VRANARQAYTRKRGNLGQVLGSNPTVVFMMNFRCEACGELRPDAMISVLKEDISESMNLPQGTATRNVNYCNDIPDCIRKARNSRERVVP